MTMVVMPILGALPLLGHEADRMQHVFVRSAGKSFVKECTISVKEDKTGWSVTSDTFRGDTPLSIGSRYDAQDRLTGATVTLTKGEGKASAKVEVNGDKAKIVRAGQPAQEFELQRGVIVTSAPDWTDIWLLCRRYDRVK